MDRQEWRPFLKRWSEEWITAHDPERDRPLDEDVVRDAWLGFARASAEEVAAAEARLGCSLPPSLREFLLVTNGWRDAGNFIYRLAGAAELLLDPDDVDDNGEWAGYWLASWSGMGPERHGSFYDLMYHLYASFHDLCRPEGQTRERWDAEVEQARLAALAGEIDEPLAVLEQAQAFGRDRARLLRFQLLAMLGDWYTLPLSHVVLIQDRAGLLRDPLFTAELLPLLFAEDRLTRRHDRFTLEHLLRTGPQAVQLIAEYQARRRDPGFRLRFGNPEFDAAVHRIVDPLTAHPAFQVPDPFTAKRSPPGLVRVSTGRPHPPGIVGVARAEEIRRRLTDAAWPELRQAIRLWRPVSEDHIAPVVLFADPVLAEMLTPERGREILSMRR